MKKLNLLNSLVFALALQSSVNTLACENNDSEVKSVFNKKNAAIAAVTLVAGYELAKICQASGKVDLKAFGKKVLELNKQDFTKIGTSVKNGVIFSGNKVLELSKKPFNYINNKRLEFVQKRQMTKGMNQLNNVAASTSKIAELNNNLVDMVNEFGEKCPCQTAVNKIKSLFY